MTSLPRSNLVQIATVASATCLSICLLKHYAQVYGAQTTAPASLAEWQAPASLETRKAFWSLLCPVIERHGIRLWLPTGSDSLKKPDPEFPTNSSFLFVGPQLFSKDSGAQLKEIKLIHGHLTAGTNREGIAVVLRVISKGEAGKEHLRMLRRVATGLESLVATNHMLPIWNEIVYDDLVCTVSPMVGPSIQDALEWKGTSTGDVLDMVQQALEGLSYLHGMHIMHRDAFVHNFLLQYLPESLIDGWPSITHPRVYIIDLECALELGPHCAEADYMVFSPPIKDRPYNMPTPPEAAVIKYNALQGDMWQFGWSLRHFSSQHSSIDNVLREMASDDPAKRPSSYDAHERLRTELGKIPPNMLHTRPLIQRPDDEDVSHLYQVWKNNGKAYMG